MNRFCSFNFISSRWSTTKTDLGHKEWWEEPDGELYCTATLLRNFQFTFFPSSQNRRIHAWKLKLALGGLESIRTKLLDKKDSLKFPTEIPTATMHNTITSRPDSVPLAIIISHLREVDITLHGTWDYCSVSWNNSAHHYESRCFLIVINNYTQCVYVIEHSVIGQPVSALPSKVLTIWYEAILRFYSTGFWTEGV